MGRPRGLAKEQRRALDRLRQVRGVERFYLAGGCAVAHHLHHRTSADLDLFSRKAGTGLESFRAAILEEIPSARVMERSDVTLKLRVEGIPIDVVEYPYPLLLPVEPGPEGFPVAARLDLAVMKLAAIARRGIRRDFWDLHELLASGLTLAEVATGYRKRFKKAEPDLYHVLRALTWFEDAEKQTVFPAGLSVARWKKIRRYFEVHAPLLIAPG